MESARIGFARTVARRVLKECRITGPPVSIEAVISFYALTLDRIPGDPAWSGQLRGEHISVNAGHAVTRQRFTAGHELGHHLLSHRASHEGFVDYVATSASGEPGEEVYVDRTKLQEIEANEFAGELLAPRSWVKAHFAKVRKPELLSPLFQLSPEAMWRACIKAGCIK
jgi:Zn-dependent peptidase ImmA (M78 family)